MTLFQSRVTSTTSVALPRLPCSTAMVSSPKLGRTMRANSNGCDVLNGELNRVSTQSDALLIAIGVCPRHSTDLPETHAFAASLCSPMPAYRADNCRPHLRHTAVNCSIQPSRLTTSVSDARQRKLKMFLILLL
jgi:hypothetical protein